MRRSFEDQLWHCYNDQHVTSITVDDIRRTYGGGFTYGSYSSMYTSSTSAYMLMYRRVDRGRNAPFMALADLPPHVQTLLDWLQERDQTEKQQKELDRSMCKVQSRLNNTLYK